MPRRGGDSRGHCRGGGGNRSSHRGGDDAPQIVSADGSSISTSHSTPLGHTRLPIGVDALCSEKDDSSDDSVEQNLADAFESTSDFQLRQRLELKKNKPAFLQRMLQNIRTQALDEDKRRANRKVPEDVLREEEPAMVGKKEDIEVFKKLQGVELRENINREDANRGNADAKYADDGNANAKFVNRGDAPDDGRGATEETEPNAQPARTTSQVFSRLAFVQSCPQPTDQAAFVISPPDLADPSQCGSGRKHAFAPLQKTASSEMHAPTKDKPATVKRSKLNLSFL